MTTMAEAREIAEKLGVQELRTAQPVIA
jgi:hypothetical protein